MDRPPNFELTLKLVGNSRVGANFRQFQQAIGTISWLERSYHSLAKIMISDYCMKLGARHYQRVFLALVFKHRA